ncbi:hypothetical protein [Sorangium atrum]|uniref:Lipoprotein n=1 Tax=Sorangium atrum TaxID=2995308 RepID=A0ABT5CHD4_9BACT|nr:hypothetical protein [Sorangium aterium]MDC0684486.1 hypothetical protein [Sorangium aterium]
MRQILLSLLVSIPLVACSTKETPGHDHERAASTQAPAAAPPPTKAPEDRAASTRPHADHNARHGGLVTMEGDNHVEVVVGADGAIDLYVSDAVRTPIPPQDVSGTITIEPKGKGEKQTLTLAPDETKGSLSAKGPAPDNGDYTWDLKVRGAPVKMTLTVPASGTAAFADAPADHPAGDHAHGSPHGGVVQSLAGGHVEVKLEKTGDITVWMLDAAEKPRSAKGVTASLRPVVAGAKETQLAYDEKADVLRGKIDPIKQDHVDGVLSVTPAGGTATSLRFAFHLEGPTGAGHDVHMGHDGHIGHEGH